MMPTDENGDRLPAFAPLATISAVSNGGIPTRCPTAIASGASSAVVEIAPGPTEHKTHAAMKTKTGITRALPRGGADRAVRQPFERAVAFGDGEEQRHAGQRQEKRHREPGHDRIGPHAGQIDADSPGERSASQPTLMREVIDTARATRRATSDRAAGVTGVR